MTAAPPYLLHEQDAPGEYEALANASIPPKADILAAVKKKLADGPLSKGKRTRARWAAGCSR